VPLELNARGGHVDGVEASVDEHERVHNGMEANQSCCSAMVVDDGGVVNGLFNVCVIE
jgi:hypothetical protein